MTSDARRTVTFDSVPFIAAPEDLFAVATAMEHEATLRYRQLAARMAERDEPQLAALFRRLEAMESEHEAGIDAWAARETITPAEHLTFRWDLPEGISPAALADVGGEEALTPWKALDLAVHNEERAFAFYVQIATKTDHARVRTYAERMAAEELEHVALLRLERRRAWRREHAGAPAEPLPETLADLEAWLAARMPLHEPPRDGDRRPWLAAEIRRQEDDYDTLMRVIDQAEDETVVRAAQGAAGAVLRRLALLRDAAAAANGG